MRIATASSEAVSVSIRKVRIGDSLRARIGRPGFCRSQVEQKSGAPL
jgi:hypothetical protein